MSNAAPPTRPWLTKRRAMLIVVLCVLAVYWPTVSFGPLEWDDHETIFSNPAFHPPSWHTALKYWRQPHMSLYVPVTYTVWTATALLSSAGDSINPVGFRMLSITLHATAAVLVLCVLHRLTRSLPAALLGALVFALHPVQVETVCWISGGKDLLGGLFSVLTLLLLLRGIDRRRWPDFVLAAIAFALALLSKPSAAVAPGWIALIALAGRRERARTVLTMGLVLLLMSIPIALIGKAVQPAPGVYAPPWYERPMVTGLSWAFYLMQVILPARLAVVYGWDVETVLHAPIAKFVWIVPLIVLALGGWAWRHGALLPAAGCAAFFVAMIPNSGLLPFEFQEQSTVADHYLYPAMMGVAVVAAWIIVRTMQVRRRDVMIGLAIVLVAVLGVRSFAQVWTWRNSHTLFHHVLSIDPGNVSANRILGFLAAREGKIDTAMQYYATALNTRPHDPVTRINRANLLLRLGDVRAAAADYAVADGSTLQRLEFYNNYGIALARLGDLNGALRQFERAMAAYPTTADPLANAAAVHARLGNLDEARRLYQEALARNPTHAQARAGLAWLDAARP